MIEVLAAEGLGFGDDEAPISTAKQMRSGELSQEAMNTAHEIIKHDPEVFPTVDSDAPDDGCGDGRPAERFFRLVEGVKTFFNKSRRRAKVFGGGLTVAASMWRTVRGEPKEGETVLGDRKFMAAELEALGITYGAHTDTHAKGENCGCGAIDKYQTITHNAVKYKDNIIGVLKALYGDAYEANESAIEAVFAVYESLAAEAGGGAYFDDASGKASMDFMLENGAVVKELRGGHMEDFIIVNDVEGTTFDQRKLAEKLKEAGVAEEVQAFVVDTWRGRMYAEKVADIAEKYPTEVGTDKETVRAQAYADFLIRTLAVSATLTAGDLPVIGRRDATKQHYALAA